MNPNIHANHPNGQSQYYYQSYHQPPPPPPIQYSQAPYQAPPLQQQQQLEPKLETAPQTEPTVSQVPTTESVDAPRPPSNSANNSLNTTNNESSTSATSKFKWNLDAREFAPSSTLTSNTSNLSVVTSPSPSLVNVSVQSASNQSLGKDSDSMAFNFLNICLNYNQTFQMRVFNYLEQIQDEAFLSD